MLPVVNFSVNYIKPAFYDDLITIKTAIRKKPSAKIIFEYEIHNENDELLTSAETTLVFVSKTTMKPIKAPSELLNALEEKMNTTNLL